MQHDLFHMKWKSSQREKEKELRRNKVKQIKDEREDQKTTERKSQYKSSKNNDQICNMKLNAFLYDSKSSINMLNQTLCPISNYYFMCGLSYFMLIKFNLVLKYKCLV